MSIYLFLISGSNSVVVINSGHPTNIIIVVVCLIAVVLIVVVGGIVIFLVVRRKRKPDTTSSSSVPTSPTGGVPVPAAGADSAAAWNVAAPSSVGLSFPVETQAQGVVGSNPATSHSFVEVDETLHCKPKEAIEETDNHVNRSRPQRPPSYTED